jgi:Holliday junction resolvase RusA-like endonuclease
MYTPAKTVAYESLIAMAAQRAIGPGSPLIGPLCVELDAVYAIPASWSKKRKADVLSGSVVPTTKPDLDNVVKAVGDGGNGILWADDSQIAVLIARKVYGEKPEVRVRVCIC